MSDVEQIRHTLAGYWQHLDDRRGEEWLALFADDAVLRFGSNVVGSLEELVIVSADLTNHAAGKHLSSNELIDVDGANGTATASSDVVFLVPGDGGAVGIGFFGRCADTLRRSDGAWKFTSRTISFQGGFHA